MDKFDIEHKAYNKRHFNVQEMEQVLRLRGLKIDVKNVFEKINYAYLIYEFSDVFYFGKLKYEKGTKLSDILSLYKFSKNASKELFGLIYEVEHIFKMHIASSISENNAFNYLCKESYEFNEDDLSFKIFFDKLKAENKRHLIQENDIIKDKTLNNISPIWIFVNSLSLGHLIKLVKYNRNIKDNHVYKKMGINWKQMSNINKYRNQIAHMNPIREKLKFKTHKDVGSVHWKDFVKSLNMIYPNSRKIIIKFWKKNKRKLPKSIRKKIYDKYFSVV